MDTLIISDPDLFSKAADLLSHDGLVAIPTETVYGLACNGLSETAVSKIFVAKGRPNDNPLILHISNLEMLTPLVKNIPEVAHTLIAHFWPGPLTLIFEATDTVPSVVRAGLPSVAIRFPSHPVMQEIISRTGLPLAAPSANISGKPSPTNAKRVKDDLYGKIDAIIDGGDSSVGLESTVIDLTGAIPMILRPGAITHRMLSEVIGLVEFDPALSHPNHTQQPKAPGMKYTHYSPDAEVIIVKGSTHNAVEEINKQVLISKAKNLRVGVLATNETQSYFKCDAVLSLGSEDNLNEIATNLFEQLRTFDDLGIDIVYTFAFEDIDIGKAIMNRLEKSAGYHIIENL